MNSNMTADIKIVLLGDIKVGKTSLVERYIHNKFNDDVTCQSVCIFT